MEAKEILAILLREKRYFRQFPLLRASIDFNKGLQTGLAQSIVLVEEYIAYNGVVRDPFAKKEEGEHPNESV